MNRSRLTLTLIAMVMIVIVAGCAKKPATMATSAPAPTGAAMSGGSLATARPAPSTTSSGTARAGSSSTTVRSDARPPVREFTTSAQLQDIYFDFDRYELRPDALRVLHTNATWLRNNARQLVLIEGHCDERGTTEYNLALGERRAMAAMNYLVSRGVDARRITVISYGEDRPQCGERSEECWAKNRRAHFLVKPE